MEYSRNERSTFRQIVLISFRSKRLRIHYDWKVHPILHNQPPSFEIVSPQAGSQNW